MTHKSIVFFSLILLCSICVQAQTGIKTNASAYADYEEMPEFVGGYDQMLRYIDLNLRTSNLHVEGVLKVRFKVDKAGYIKNVEIINNLSTDADAEARRLIHAMPRWKPATDEEGLLVDMEYTLSIKFKSKPEFVGGLQAYKEYIKENRQSIKSDIRGRVIVGFDIDEEGNVTNAEVAKSLSPEADAEALRLVKAMPQWKPASMNGQATNMYQQVTISF